MLFILVLAILMKALRHPNRFAEGSSGASHQTVLSQAVVGVGVLGLPSALSHLTWAGGLALLTLSAAVSLYTSYLLAALHESPDGKTRHNRRAERPWHLEGPPGRQSQYV